MIAGCGFATNLLKVYMIIVLDLIHRWFPVQLHVFVDDVDLNAIRGSPGEAAQAVAAAAERLLTEFGRVLKLGRAAQVYGAWLP